jgi:hypothetical protein
MLASGNEESRFRDLARLMAILNFAESVFFHAAGPSANLHDGCDSADAPPKGWFYAAILIGS